MDKKIKVAFIYHSSNVFLTGKHFDNTYYHFFMEALRRNDKIEVTDFASEEKFDAKILKNKFELVLLWQNEKFGMPDELIGMEDLEIPVVANVGDPNVVKKSIKFHKKWKIDYYFHYYPESLFHDWYPKNFKYKMIVFGVEPKLYQNLTPFKKRIKNKILNSGAAGTTKTISRIINQIRNPKWNSNQYYKLRTKCNELPFVEYTTTLKHEFVGDKYPLLLQKYAAAIASTTPETSIKYWEIPSAGCLTFMEITEKNKGKYLGYIDGENALFINEKNYKEKFDEYLTDIENPKWEKIANSGRDYAMKNFNNDKAVVSLVELMESLVN